MTGGKARSVQDGCRRVQGRPGCGGLRCGRSGRCRGDPLGARKAHGRDRAQAPVLRRQAEVAGMRRAQSWAGTVPLRFRFFQLGGLPRLRDGTTPSSSAGYPCWTMAKDMVA